MSCHWPKQYSKVSKNCLCTGVLCKIRIPYICVYNIYSVFFSICLDIFTANSTLYTHNPLQPSPIHFRAIKTTSHQLDVEIASEIKLLQSMHLAWSEYTCDTVARPIKGRHARYTSNSLPYSRDQAHKFTIPDPNMSKKRGSSHNTDPNILLNSFTNYQNNIKLTISNITINQETKN